jgi:hypothetical protein
LRSFTVAALLAISEPAHDERSESAACSPEPPSGAVASKKLRVIGATLKAADAFSVRANLT